MDNQKGDHNSIFINKDTLLQSDSGYWKFIIVTINYCLLNSTENLV